MTSRRPGFETSQYDLGGRREGTRGYRSQRQEDAAPRGTTPATGLDARRRRHSPARGARGVRRQPDRAPGPHRRPAAAARSPRGGRPLPVPRPPLGPAPPSAATATSSSSTSSASQAWWRPIGARPRRRLRVPDGRRRHRQRGTDPDRVRRPARCRPATSAAIPVTGRTCGPSPRPTRSPASGAPQPPAGNGHDGNGSFTRHRLLPRRAADLRSRPAGPPAPAGGDLGHRHAARGGPRRPGRPALRARSCWPTSTWCATPTDHARDAGRRHPAEHAGTARALVGGVVDQHRASAAPRWRCGRRTTPWWWRRGHRAGRWCHSPQSFSPVFAGHAADAVRSRTSTPSNGQLTVSMSASLVTVQVKIGGKTVPKWLFKPTTVPFTLNFNSTGS